MPPATAGASSTLRRSWMAGIGRPGWLRRRIYVMIAYILEDVCAAYAPAAGAHVKRVGEARADTPYSLGRSTRCARAWVSACPIAPHEPATSHETRSSEPTESTVRRR